MITNKKLKNNHLLILIIITMDISCIPYDIKLIIMNYLPINTLIIDNPPKIFHNYLINYINKQLLTNMYVAGILYENNIYNIIINNKVNEISQNITDKFMKAVDEIGGPSLVYNQTAPIISLKIIFKFTEVGESYTGNTRDIDYRISSYSLYNNCCTWIYNYKYCTLEYNKQNIQNEICRILIKNMNISDTTIDIKSMEMVKTNISETYNIFLFKFI